MSFTAQLTADAFNRLGKFTARTVENNCAIEVRYADTGEVAATVWLPEPTSENPIGSDQWMWLGGQPGMGIRRLPKSTPLDVLIPAVATHVLDEARR
jgi:hypothetical protein